MSASVYAANEPALSTYDKIKEKDTPLTYFPELILKLANDTKRTFYVLGTTINDVPHRVEIRKGPKWVPVPSFGCGTMDSLRRFLPGSEILFHVYDAPLSNYDQVFRVRVYLYTEAYLPTLLREMDSPLDPKQKPYIEILSQEYSSNDFLPSKPEGWKPPKFPGEDLAEPNGTEPADTSNSSTRVTPAADSPVAPRSDGR